VTCLRRSALRRQIVFSGTFATDFIERKYAMEAIRQRLMVGLVFLATLCPLLAAILIMDAPPAAYPAGT
jgi:hypothetical protein